MPPCAQRPRRPSHPARRCAAGVLDVERRGLDSGGISPWSRARRQELHRQLRRDETVLAREADAAMRGDGCSGTSPPASVPIDRAGGVRVFPELPVRVQVGFRRAAVRQRIQNELARARTGEVRNELPRELLCGRGFERIHGLRPARAGALQEGRWVVIRYSNRTWRLQRAFYATIEGASRWKLEPARQLRLNRALSQIELRYVGERACTPGHRCEQVRFSHCLSPSLLRARGADLQHSAIRFEMLDLPGLTFTLCARAPGASQGFLSSGGPSHSGSPT